MLTPCDMRELITMIQAIGLNPRSDAKEMRLVDIRPARWRLRTVWRRLGQIGKRHSRIHPQTQKMLSSRTRKIIQEKVLSWLLVTGQSE